MMLLIVNWISELHYEYERREPHSSCTRNTKKLLKFNASLYISPNHKKIRHRISNPLP